jgi:hypothetical protein
MKPESPRIKPQPRLGVSPILRSFMLVTALKMRPLLRPSARRDLLRFVGTLDSDEHAKAFLEWGVRVIKAHHEDAKSLRRPRAKQLIAQTELPIFRRPDRAYRVRWLL